MPEVVNATILGAPSMAIWARQSVRWPRARFDVELFLEAQRDQLPLWLPVAFGTGIAAWFGLSGADQWLAWLCAMAAVLGIALMLDRHGRLRRVMIIASLAGASGIGIAWVRSSAVAEPVLPRPVIAIFSAQVEQVDVQVARDRVRVMLIPDANSGLPGRVRVNIDQQNITSSLAAGDRIRLRARLVAPPGPSIPGGYDFARTAWYLQLGATGKALGPVERLSATTHELGLRERLSAHVRAQLPGSAGGIAAAFASGDRGGIAPADEVSMRESGLTHLLSISGLHVTAVVGAAMLLTLRLLALSPFLARRLPLIMIAAAMGAAAGIGYTWLTGAEVPTIRSCVAALLVLVGVAIGRQAITLRLVACGALAVMALWPEALIGPSFQLSFAAITSIVAIHQSNALKTLVGERDEAFLLRVAREGLSLLVTGMVVEAALAPIALYHFHRQGVYGAFANIVAIPLTTFVTMPFEALALLFDPLGFGRPFWVVTGWSLNFLLWISHHVAAWPASVATFPSIPVGAYALMLFGGLWLMLWRGDICRWGVVILALGAVWAWRAPVPDVLVTGDGVHLAVRGDDGRLAILRLRAGDYIRSEMAERFGDLGTLDDLDTLPGAQCSDDLCRVDLKRGGRMWRITATRTPYIIPKRQFSAECAAADIIVSARRLPEWCHPRWLKADRTLLARTGGLAISLTDPRVETVSEVEGAHPWVAAPLPPPVSMRRF